MNYTLLIRQNATKATFVIRGLQDEGTDLLHCFKDFHMPEEIQQGELTYALFIDNTTDPEYNLNEVLLESTVTVADVTIAVKHLNPEVGIIKYSEDKEQGSFLINNQGNRYYQK